MRLVRLLLAQRHLAVLVCASALLLKLLVPTGYMIQNDHGRIAITICSGMTPAPTMTAMAGMHGDMADHGTSKDGTKPELPCAFAGLSAAALGAIDPLQLTALIAFVMTVGLLGVLLPAPSDPAYLRPPLRGPPAYR